MASGLLKNHANIIRAAVGDTSHIVDLIALYESNSYCFRRIFVAKALSLPEIKSSPTSWDDAVLGDHSKELTLTRVGECILIEKFGAAVWLIEMHHMGAPSSQAFVSNTSKFKALCADSLFGLGEVLDLEQRHANFGSVREGAQDASSIRRILQVICGHRR